MKRKREENNEKSQGQVGNQPPTRLDYLKRRRIENDEVLIDRIMDQIHQEETGQDVRVDLLKLFSIAQVKNLKTHTLLNDYGLTGGLAQERIYRGNYTNETSTIVTREDFFKYLFPEIKRGYGDRNRKLNILKMMRLKKYKHGTLKKLVEPYLPEYTEPFPSYFDRQTEYVYAKCCGIDLDSTKRRIEKENLENFDPRQIFSELCGICVPADIMYEIFDHLRQNKKTLDTILCECESWYLLYLSSWKSVCVGKSNVRKIPVTVLQNVKTIEMNFDKGVFKKDVIYVHQNAKSVQNLLILDGTWLTVKRFFDWIPGDAVYRNLVSLVIPNHYHMKIEKKKFPNMKTLEFGEYFPSHSHSVFDIDWRLHPETFETLDNLRTIVFHGAAEIREHSRRRLDDVKYFITARMRLEDVKYFLPEEFKDLQTLRELKIHPFQQIHIGRKVDERSLYYNCKNDFLFSILSGSLKDETFTRISQMKSLQKLCLFYPHRSGQTESKILSHHAKGIKLCLEKLEYLEHMRFDIKCKKLSSTLPKEIGKRRFLPFDSATTRDDFFASLNSVSGKLRLEVEFELSICYEDEDLEDEDEWEVLMDEIEKAILTETEALSGVYATDEDEAWYETEKTDYCTFNVKYKKK